MLNPGSRLAIYMEGAVGESSGKMGYGLLRYSPHEIVAVIDSRHTGRNIQELTDSPRSVPVVGRLVEAVALGADVLVLGIAPSGGLIPEEWWPVIREAVDGLGLSVVNGLHDRIGPHFPSLRQGQFVWDLRQEPEGLGVGTGAAAKLGNRRILFIGTDMAIGKMTAGLEVWRAAREQGIDARFVATGQIGITIMGEGVPLDAVRVDYASSAVEREVIKHADAEWILIEGQGALLHPGSTANLPLLRGSCPTDLILCHRAGQEHLMKLPGIRIPDLAAYVRLYQDLAEVVGTYPRPMWAGMALNTSGLGESEARTACETWEDELGVPVIDPIRQGVTRLVTALR